MFYLVSPAGLEPATSRSTNGLREAGAYKLRWDGRDDDEEKYIVAFAEDGPDEGLLQDLDVDLDLHGILPEDEVDEQDSWEFKASEFGHVLALGGDLHFADEEVQVDLEGTVSCTFKGTKEVDGVTLGVIAVEFDAHGEEELGGVVASSTLAFEFKLAGELLWNLDSRHIHSFELFGDMEMTLTSAIVEGESENGFRLAGTMSVAVTAQEG